jgi:hypothetical protein
MVMRKNKVVILQNQMRLDKTSGKLVNKFDFSSAEKYGELEFLLSPTARPFNNNDSIISELRANLCAFSSNDHLLLVGNPILIGITTSIAVDYCSEVNFLQWSGKEKQYLPVKIDFT